MKLRFRKIIFWPIFVLTLPIWLSFWCAVGVFWLLGWICYGIADAMLFIWDWCCMMTKRAEGLE